MASPGTGTPESGGRPSVRPRSSHEGVGEPAAKRIRANDDPQTSGVSGGVAGTTARRQAACHQCRLRKVKCDKQRPSCNICKVSGQDCEYVGEPSERLSLETATRTLLDRFDELQREFEDVKKTLASRDSQAQHSLPLPHQQDTQPHMPQPRISPQTPSSAEATRDFLQIPPHRASADTILQWEIFQDKYPAHALIGELFKPSDDSKGPSLDTLVPAGGITPLDDELIPTLIDRFLQNVHTKNPILDVEALVKHGRRCADQGVGWDGRSCLVLMACALGSVAKPFDKSVEPAVNENFPRSHNLPSSRVFAKELQQGDSCFTLACRRLGSLKYSMIGAQCHFFAGVYLMYTLRPLLSWHYFLHASIFCQVHLRMTKGISGSFSETLSVAPLRAANLTADRKSRRLEQSLYWSCFKSECEFRVELPLAQSEISLGEYPDLFPSPPSPVSSGTANMSSSSSMSDEAVELRQHTIRLCNEEESWYYYLTEIALRRIGNRIVNTFFEQDRSSWLNIKPLLRMAQEFEAQVSSWSAHLPPAMQHYQTTSIIRAPHLNFLNEGTGSHVSQELSWAIDNRLLEMQTWLYQPFLYYLIHSGYPRSSQAVNGQASSHQPRISSLLNPFSPVNTRLDSSFLSQVSPPTPTTLGFDNDDMIVLHSLISSGIECCLKTIDVRLLSHRHHGLWFDLRSIMSASLVLLAIVKSGNAAWIPGGVELLWGTATSAGDYWAGASPTPIGGKMARVLSQLEFWAGEAPDLLRYKDVLEAVLRDVRGS